MRLTFVATLASLLAALSVAAAETPTQLPRTVRPTHYDVAVVPNAKALTFTGKVTIAIEVLQPTSSIVLNAIDMTFTSVQLTGDAKTTFAAPNVRVNDAEQTATFTFNKPIAKGSYRLAMSYRGKIGTQAVGLFAIDYDTAAGAKRALYTQFENSDARRFIPSWDEPAFKTTFALEATFPSNQMAVSNMPVAEKTALAGGLERVRFALSPKMSTYLLFFGVGEFDRATAKVDGVEVGVVTQKGLAAQAAFALEASRVVLHEYNEYFGIPYPLPKLDNIASPGSSQFFGAMENWGAIYTFEHAMLLDPSIATQSDKQSVFAVAAHEISHQWFGDLVTMSWWDDLWLNEGFASWMESRTTARLHPEWNTALEAIGGREAAMWRDALATTHPVVQHITTVEQASQAFDSITYQKGEAVIHMLEGYVGADAWRAGVRQYLKKHLYSNTVSDDLWREIEAAANKPITAIAHDFTLLPGVPMIRVSDSVCTAGNTTLQLTQTEFSKDQPAKKPLQWRVPVIVKTLGADAEVRTVVAEGKATVTLKGCGPAIINAGQSGYYRTLYSPQQFAQIKDKFASLAAIDQLGILSDTSSLGLTGLQPASNVLDLINATPSNADPQIWGNIAGKFDGINDLYGEDKQAAAKLHAFAIAKLAPVFSQVGWKAKPGELGTIAILRNELVSTLSMLGDRTVISEAQRRYQASKSDATEIPAPMRKTILAVVARHADAATWELLHKAAQNEKTPLVKDNLYGLLAIAEDKALAQRALDLALTSEPGATNSAGMIARVAYSHPDMAFDFAVAHQAQVNEKVDASSRSRYFAGLGSGSIDPAMIKKINAYAAANLAPEARRDAETAVASVAYRIKVRKERLPEIDAWLASNAR